MDKGSGLLLQGVAMAADCLRWHASTSQLFLSTADSCL
ncbi:hypothetical protein GZL_04421 [Streptomyces sp. 769]|nr:hypothetical protein GZL_04421 [Streptomyces sp. 769]